MRTCLLFALVIALFGGAFAAVREEVWRPRPAVHGGPSPETIVVWLPGEVPVSIERLARKLGARLRAVVAVDEALRGRSIRLHADAMLGFDELRRLLDLLGVTIAGEEIDGRSVLKVYLQRCGPPWGLGVGDDGPIAAVLRPVGSSAACLADAIRARMARDPRRLGVVAAVGGAVILVDVAERVEEYARLLGARAGSRRLARPGGP